MAKKVTKEKAGSKRPIPKTAKYQTIFKPVIYLLVLIVAILYAPFMKSLNFRSRQYTDYLAESFDGPYAENDILSKATKLFTDEVEGPESLAPFEGKVYVGLQDGRILQISDNKYSTFTTVGISNGTCPAWQEKRCGRPLGNRVTSKGDLYTIDAYHGVLKTSIKAPSPKPELVMSSDLLIEGNSSKFLDDLVIDEGAGTSGGNVIYMTDASSHFDLSEVVPTMLDQDDTGRVIQYDEVAKKATVIMKGLLFPNGIELTDDKTSILVCEITNKRILRHYVKGPKAGTTEVLIDRLPGEPDNIRRSTRKDKETYWVALAIARTTQNPDLIDWGENKPFLRNFALRTIYAVGNLVQFFGQLIQSPDLTLKGWEIKTFKLFNLFTFRGMALEIDVSGKIVSCLHSPDGSITLLSEVREVIEGNSRVLYLGSVYNKYIGKLVLS